jgi:hypothetical protein
MAVTHQQKGARPQRPKGPENPLYP